MIIMDTKFFKHLIECLETQKVIYLKPLKEKILWQDRIDKLVDQCKELVDDAIAEEKKVIRKRALQVIPDSSLFDDTTESLEEREIE
jgi:hypothetical protein